VRLEDDCPLLWGEGWGRGWGKRKTPSVVPLPNARQRQTYYGTLTLGTQEFQLRQSVAGTGKTTVAYMAWGQTRYPAKKVLLLGDGASYPRGAALQEVLTRENAGLPAADWQVTCLLFAPNAPEQNPTADGWLKGQQYLHKHFAVNKTFAQVTRGFSEFLTSLSFTSAKLRWYWPEEQLI
jgi:hypothetical protein